ncbi:DUF3343 domain-containing protein [Filifactor villosus]|uniref:DUF3343 domain-containing protein n=1 Tax=Filifactor villosus TaxID=29374 RepID=A0ABV9QNM3_9FIRM
MKTKKFYVLLANSALALRLYQELRAHCVDSTMAPTPREADHCCGVCILYTKQEDKKTIMTVAEEAGICIDTFYECENTDDPNRMKFC